MYIIARTVNRIFERCIRILVSSEIVIVSSVASSIDMKQGNWKDEMICTAPSALFSYME